MLKTDDHVLTVFCLLAKTFTYYPNFQRICHVYTCRLFEEKVKVPFILLAGIRKVKNSMSVSNTESTKIYSLPGVFVVESGKITV